MKDKFDINEYFSGKEIIKILCHKRAVAAKKGHDDHFLRNISSKADSPHKHKTKEIFSFFPARSKWIRLDKKEREIRDANAVEINSIQLERTVWKEIKKYRKTGEVKPDWLIKLEAFIVDIQDAVSSEHVTYNILTPKIIPVLKDKKDCVYRPICLFKIKDLIITGQIAKYLTYCFDPLFSDSSYAFRAGNTKTKIFNHHSAIEDIVQFKTKLNSPLYVAECDIKKFFDCVNHTVIIEKFNEIVNEAKEKLGITINSRAVYFFNSYLNAFTFNENIHKIEQKLLKSYGILKGTIPWVKHQELLEVGSDKDSERIGVPQGGAISCLIANILLNYVDKKVNAGSDENTFYGRFCDDMVLMHPNQANCEKLLETYQNALKEVKLIVHKPLEFENYGKPFWSDKLKSKLPYQWDQFNTLVPETKKNVPWLAFVGYQIRHDGLIRVRKKSIAKELKKQVSETDKIIKIVRKTHKPSINKKAIIFRLQQRLISMAVGRVKSGKYKTSMCWCAGFKVLKSAPNVTSQTRNLDRNRENQINRLESYLRKVKTPIRKSKKKITPLKHYGASYSYSKQFVKRGNQESGSS